MEEYDMHAYLMTSKNKSEDISYLIFRGSASFCLKSAFEYEYKPLSSLKLRPFILMEPALITERRSILI